MKNHDIHSIIILCFALTLVVYACAPMQINGGGTLPSASLGARDKANFGFSGNSCTPGVITGEFNYHDKKAPGWPDGGVKLNGVVIDGGKCSEMDESSILGIACGICNLRFCNCDKWPEDWEACAFDYLLTEGLCPDIMEKIPNNLYAVAFPFTSTNPRYPGSGMGVACLTDNGQGKKAIDNDHVVLIIVNGQYLGYINEGPVQGNISSGPCN